MPDPKGQGTGAVVVTGGSRGIGAAIAREIAARGLRVACLSRTATLPDGVAAADGHRVFACDVTDEAALRQGMARAAAEMGGLSGLVANAGLHEQAKSAELPTALYERVMQVNATAVMTSCREAYPHLVKAGGGRIVVIGSFWAQLGVARNLAYCASKAAVEAMTRVLAVEWARDNIQLACVAPGYIETDMNRAELAEERTQAFLKARIPMRRVGRPEEVARLVACLLAEDMPFLTGEVIRIDGGHTVNH